MKIVKHAIWFSLLILRFVFEFCSPFKHTHTHAHVYMDCFQHIHLEVSYGKPNWILKHTHWTHEGVGNKGEVSAFHSANQYISRAHTDAHAHAPRWLPLCNFSFGTGRCSLCLGVSTRFFFIFRNQSNAGSSSSSSTLVVFGHQALLFYLLLTSISHAPTVRAGAWPVNTEAGGKLPPPTSAWLPALPACLLDIHQAISSIDWLIIFLINDWRRRWLPLWLSVCMPGLVCLPAGVIYGVQKSQAKDL